VNPPQPIVSPPAKPPETAAKKAETREELHTEDIVFRFNKKWLMPNSCMTEEKSAGGNILKCPIELPAEVKGGVVRVKFTCDPAGSAECQHTTECPGGGACPNHLYTDARTYFADLAQGVLPFPAEEPTQ
jgi:hypothetical protein